MPAFQEPVMRPITQIVTTTFLAGTLALLSTCAIQFDKGITMNEADCNWGSQPNNTTTFNFTDDELEQAFSTDTLTAEHIIYMREQGIAWNVDIEHHEYNIRRK
jgi:hypothetical protein